MKKTHIINLSLLFILSLSLGWHFLSKGFYPMHDDLQVMRVFQMDRCFDDGQIPCRWSPNIAYDYGQAMFNYYSAFPYYLGQLIHFLGFSYIGTVKMLSFLCLPFSAIFFYLFISQLVKPKAALLASAIYLTAPYHALNIFVRGALSEMYALALLPAVFAAVIYVIKKPNILSSTLLSFSLFAFLTTHNTSNIINFPLISASSLIFLFLYSKKRLRSFLFLTFGGILGLGASSFFLLPVAFERSLINPEIFTQGYFSYLAHFATLKQIFFKTAWGFGPSIFGPEDDLSFFLGVFPVIALFLSPFVSLFYFKHKNYRQLSIVIFFLFFTLLTTFLIHPRSVKIWDTFPVLSFAQFPWRFLGPAAFTASILAAFGLTTFENAKRPLNSLLYLLLVPIMLVNFGYFKYELVFPEVTDQHKLSGALYELQIAAAMGDYLPNHVSQVPRSQAPSEPRILEGEVKTNYYDERSNYFSAEFDVYSDNALIQFPVMYFPNWTLYKDRSIEKFPFTYDNEVGAITISLNKGHHLIQAWFENTPIRSIANIITLASFALLLLINILNERFLKKKVQ